MGPNGPQNRLQSRPQNRIQNRPQNRVQNRPQNRVQNKPQNEVQNGPQNRIQNGKNDIQSWVLIDPISVNFQVRNGQEIAIRPTKKADF